MLYKVVITYKSVDETLVCDHSNESDWAVLPYGDVYYTVKVVLLSGKLSFRLDLLVFCVIVGYWLLFHKCSNAT